MYLIDTNIVIYYLENQTDAVNFLHTHSEELYISVISVIEVLSFKFASTQQEQIVREFLEDNFVWLGIDNEIINTTANIRRQRKIKTPDAIIGATALTNKLILVTRNTKDFKHITDIRCINPLNN